MELLPSLPVSSFIHIDPYEIDKSGEPGGFTYFDVFLEAAQAGIKCYLWYGFMTLSVKEQLNAYILNGLRKNKIKVYHITLKAVRVKSGRLFCVVDLERRKIFR